MGGYLVVNAGGRPLEFHCTSPVKPNRAQEILYGPTLRPYLCGEQIGAALVAKAKSEVLLVLTEDADTLSVREFLSLPVLLVEAKQESAAKRSLHSFMLGTSPVALESRYSSDQQQVLDCWQTHGHSLDLAEPFGRIREALEEAQKSARAA